MGSHGTTKRWGGPRLPISKQISWPRWWASGWKTVRLVVGRIWPFDRYFEIIGVRVLPFLNFQIFEFKFWCGPKCDYWWSADLVRSWIISGRTWRNITTRSVDGTRMAWQCHANQMLQRSPRWDSYHWWRPGFYLELKLLHSAGANWAAMSCYCWPNIINVRPDQRVCSEHSSAQRFNTQHVAFAIILTRIWLKISFKCPGVLSIFRLEPLGRTRSILEHYMKIGNCGDDNLAPFSLLPFCWSDLTWLYKAPWVKFEGLDCLQHFKTHNDNIGPGVQICYLHLYIHSQRMFRAGLNRSLDYNSIQNLKAVPRHYLLPFNIWSSSSRAWHVLVGGVGDDWRSTLFRFGVSS